ncbi:MAG: sulfotransferase family protein [Pseudomonadota bacterium]
MTLRVIGAGVGRTATYSLKLALEELGFGPCYHMEEVAKDIPAGVPLWNAAARGAPDWRTIFDGFNSAVDWPVACFYRELHAAYPDAKFVLGYRDPATWADSFSETIQSLIVGGQDAPEPMQDWLAMARRIITKTGIPLEADKSALEAAFNAHLDAVKAAIPASQLLMFQAREGWEPLCRFLGKPVPDGPFPRSNNRTEFWDLVDSATAEP